MKNILEVDSVLLAYDLRKILTDVYLKSETGKVIGILGRNGTGKSSLMKIIFGELNPNSRSVRINEKALLGSKRNPKEIRYLPQNYFIPKSLTVGRVIKDFELDFEKLVYEFPNFKKHLNSKVGNLSGGERRILEIYAILFSESKFCLLDEPFSQVMPIDVEKLKDLILMEKERKGIIVSDHLYKHIVEISDDLYVISQGKTHLTERVEDLVTLGYLRTTSDYKQRS